MYCVYPANNSFVKNLSCLTGLELELTKKTDIIFEKEPHIGYTVL